jgi:hypothetical protein
MSLSTKQRRARRRRNIIIETIWHNRHFGVEIPKYWGDQAFKLKRLGFNNLKHLQDVWGALANKDPYNSYWLEDRTDYIYWRVRTLVIGEVESMHSYRTRCWR